MGAIGGCEAVTQALNKHIDDDISVTQHAVRAVGSLAFKDEGMYIYIYIYIYTYICINIQLYTLVQKGSQLRL
jgi:hypothetical protein